MTRLWGAIMFHGQPRAEVRDVEAGDARTALDDSEFRVWCLADLDFADGSEFPKDHTGWKFCEPGAPCRKCQATAVDYWYVWAERREERLYFSATEAARVRGPEHIRSDEHCSCNGGKGHDTVEKARKCASRRHWSLVLEMDGAGHRLRWIESASGQLPLLGGERP